MRLQSDKPKKPLKARKPLVAKQGLVAKTYIKPSKAKQPSVAKLKKLADKYWSQATRYRFAELKDGVFYADCITCPANSPIKKLQCGHFMSRQFNSTRYLEQNTAPQCYGCNVMQQGKQYEFGIALDALYGDGTAKEMHKLAKTPHQFNTQELLDIIAEAKEECFYYEQQLDTIKE